MMGGNAAGDTPRTAAAACVGVRALDGGSRDGALISWPSAVNSPERLTGFFKTIGLRSKRGIAPDL